MLYLFFVQFFLLHMPLDSFVSSRVWYKICIVVENVSSRTLINSNVPQVVTWIKSL